MILLDGRIRIRKKYFRIQEAQNVMNLGIRTTGCNNKNICFYEIYLFILMEIHVKTWIDVQMLLQ
jgi:hypothetical protein